PSISMLGKDVVTKRVDGLSFRTPSLSVLIGATNL
ncbi:MAG: hypothetical protein SLRJCFUN_000957, partial [Candidatus Fervidibacter sp.]